MKNYFRTIAIYAVTISFILSLFSVASAEKIVTAEQVNGTWKSKNGSFKILALGKKKLKVEFFGTYKYESSDGPMANIGECNGIAYITGDTAIFRPNSSFKKCKITLKFVSGKLIITEVGFCGFGLNVTTEGTYNKIDNNKPEFDNP